MTANERMFVRLDVYNPLDSEARLTIRSPEAPELNFTVMPHQLRRIKTGWMDRVSSVEMESEALPSLLFDNLAYSPYLWGAPTRP